MRREALDRLAAAQMALFTRRQALECGLSVRQLEHGTRTGRWCRLYRNVYRMAGTPPSDLQSLYAAVLAGGAGAVASHRGAGWLWGLSDQLRLEIAGPLQRSPGRGVIVHRRPLDDIRVVVRRGVPSTDPLRTVVDLAARGDEALVVGALDRGIANGLYTASAVGAELQRRSGKGVPGVALLRGVLGRRLDAEGERTSALESAMDRLLVRLGLLMPVRQYRVPGTRYRLDYAWPTFRLTVEIDGYADHAGLDAFRYDRERQNALVLAGWTVLRFTWADVRDRPEWVAVQIERALESLSASA